MATNIGPKIGIEGEKEFRNSLKAIDSEMRTLDTQLKNLSREYDANDKSVEGLTKKQQLLSSAVSSSEAKVKLLTGEYTKQKAELDKLEAALETARKENGEGSDEAIRAEVAYAKQAAAVNNLEGKLETAKGQLAAYNDRLQELGNRATLAGDKITAAGDKISAVGSKISGAGNALSLGVTAPLVAAAGASIAMASDYDESANKVQVAFGDAADSVMEFSETTVDAFGISKGTALDMAALYGDMGTSMGITQDAAAAMSTELVGLAGDLASFKNLSLDEAQNALKGIFTGETESLKNLGVVMTETNLNAYALANGFEKTTAEMTEAEKVQLRYQYVLSATKNAQGDYARTADGTANSLRTMQESAQELGIAFGQELLPEVTPLIQKGTELIKTFGDLDDNQKQLIVRSGAVAAAAGPVLKVAGTATTAIGKVTSGIGGLVKDMGKIKAAGGEAVDGVSGLASALSKLGPKGMIIGGAVAGIAAIGVAAYNAYQDTIQAKIDERFGDIKLSAEEVEDVAKRLTTTEWSVKVSAAFEAKEKLDSYEQEIQGAVEELNKLNWKVDVGLNLNENEKSNYLSAVDSYIAGVADYVSQQGYAVRLAIDATIGTDDGMGAGLAAFTDTFYSETQAELDGLGKKLAEKVNTAFENDTLSEDKVDIQKIINQMQELTAKVSEAEYQAKLKNLRMEYSAEGIGIDEDSFLRLNEKITEDTQALLDQSEETTITALTGVELQYQEMLDNGTPREFAEKVRADAEAEIRATVLENQGQAINVGYDFAFDTITDNFQTEISSATAEITETAQTYAKKISEAYIQGKEVTEQDYFEFFNALPQLTGPAKKAVEDMLSSLAPQKESLEAIRDQCLAAGQEIPESVQEGLSNITLWEAMVGNTDAMFALLGEEISNNPAQLNILKQTDEFGRSIPETLGTAIGDSTNAIYDPTIGLWTAIQTTSEEHVPMVLEYLNSKGIEMDEELASSIAAQYGLVKNSTTGLWEQAKNGTSEAAPSAQSVAKNAGVKLGTETAAGIKSTEGTVKQSASGVGVAAAWAMQGAVSGVVIKPPSMSNPDWSAQAASGRYTMQYYLDNNPLRATANLVVNAAGSLLSSITGYATGGIVDTPQLATVAETGAEAIIPLENHRERAVALWEEAGERLNVYAADAGRNRGAQVQKRAIQQSMDKSVHVDFGDINIEIEAKSADPEEVYRVFKRRLYVDVEREVRGRGGA